MNFWEKENRYETKEEKEERIAKEKFEKEVQQEKEMLSRQDVDVDIISDRIERYIFSTNCDYYRLCKYALYNRPAWKRVIRENTLHFVTLIESFTKYRQHQHNVYGDPGTNARRDVTYDTPDQNRFI